MDQWQPEVNEIYLDAIEIEDPQDRERFIAQKCSGNDHIRSQVASMLEADERAKGFLDAPATTEYARTNELKMVHVGMRIGNYKLLQELGEGGFGIVYMAEQKEPVRRKVALKIIKPGMDTREVIARFDAERQAIAIMEHPNIAKVFDAGTTVDGRPYFVMELINGTPITQFCDENRLSNRQRLDLFISVCNAVQHAHQKGVIHRDIKPTNVMVTLSDREPLTKVIDFGVAKAINRELTDKTLFTSYGQMIGTPQYMSPEQAAVRASDLDTRSDIYSLGVLLFELLTGSPPLDAERLRKSGFAEIQRMICEEEPPKPSTRVSRLGNHLAVVADNRKVGPAKLHKEIAGDLDWIVMKCLEKDRTRRYDSASGLAMDISRHLDDEQVVACPPTTAYRISKLWRKNRIAILLASAIAIVLISATLVSLRYANSAKRLLLQSQLNLYAADIPNAHSAIRDEHLGAANRILSEQARVAPTLLGFEWRLLVRIAHGDQLTTVGLPEPINSVITIGEDQVAVATNVGDVFVCNVANGQIVRQLKEGTIANQSLNMHRLVFSVKNQCLVYFGQLAVEVWDINTWDRVDVTDHNSLRGPTGLLVFLLMSRSLPPGLTTLQRFGGQVTWNSLDRSSLGPSILAEHWHFYRLDLPLRLVSGSPTPFLKFGIFKKLPSSLRAVGLGSRLIRAQCWPKTITCCVRQHKETWCSLTRTPGMKSEGSAKHIRFLCLIFLSPHLARLFTQPVETTC